MTKRKGKHECEGGSLWEGLRGRSPSSQPLPKPEVGDLLGDLVDVPHLGGGELLIEDDELDVLLEALRDDFLGGGGRGRRGRRSEE